MSIEAKFSFGEQTPATFSITPFVPNIEADFGVDGVDGDTRYRNSNTTLGAGEIISTMSRTQKNCETRVEVEFPYEGNSTQYVIRDDATLVATSENNPEYRVDYPIVAQLTIRHPLAAPITGEHVDQVVRRLLGVCYDKDGNQRYDRFMRKITHID
jgi:hypothetical protein